MTLRKVLSYTPKISRDGLFPLGPTQLALIDKRVDPRQRNVILFPDGDNAYVGMGSKLISTSSAQKIYEEASQKANKDILKMCLDGPQELLKSFENRFLATLVTSHATISTLEQEQLERSKAAGGFGIGFINSLVFGGAISFENAVELVQTQGRAIDRALQVVPNGKVRVRLRPASRKDLICRSAHEHCVKLGLAPEIAICQVTKKLSPHVIEISGHEEAIKYLEDEGQRLFEFHRIARVKNSPSAANTDLMRPVRDFMEAFLREKTLEDPEYLQEPLKCSAYSSTAARRLRNPGNIKKDIIGFSVNPVLVEPLITCLFKRPDHLPQPNIIVVWDKKLLKTLERVNRRAFASSKLLG